MIYFATNRYELSTDPNCDFQYEVLNELKDGSSGKIENLSKHTRFLFEVDTMPIKEQWDMIEPILDNITRVVYSGGKSLHTIIEFAPEYENQCKNFYGYIWNVINDTYFNGKADTQCKNPNRLTRRPNAFRWDEKHINVKQTSLHNKPGNYFKNASAVIRDARSIQQMNYVKNALKPQVKTNNNKSHDGMCIRYDVIRHYLDTPYTKICGNGDSNISLFKALATCIKYNDNETLNKVIQKAKSEKWTDKEIDKKISDIKLKQIQ